TTGYEAVRSMTSRPDDEVRFGVTDLDLSAPDVPAEEMLFVPGGLSSPNPGASGTGSLVPSPALVPGP
ncbi:MAG TPA: hypothetical protein VD813_02395, partial [Pseudonocardia sp.]|nr:hypothetical protein [Pseudonocardia sp.]